MMPMLPGAATENETAPAPVGVQLVRGRSSTTGSIVAVTSLSV